MPEASLIPLFERCAFAGYDRQTWMVELHGDDAWAVDLDEGVITFGRKTTYRVQLLGSESDATDSWMWAWANDSAELADPLLESARSLREMGESFKVPGLTTPSFRFNELEGHEVAIIGMVMLSEPAYFRAPYDDGAEYLLIHDAAFPAPTQPLTERIERVILETLATWELDDHRLGIEGWLKGLGVPMHAQSTAIHVECGDATIVIGFDDRRRVTGVTTS